MNTTRTIARTAVETRRRVQIARDAPAPIPVVGDGATLDALLIPWNVAAEVTDDGRSVYRESWEPGSIEPAPVVAVYGNHVQTPRGLERGPLIGRATEFDSRPDGLHGVIHLFTTGDGVHAYQAAAHGMAAVSIEAETDDAGAGADGTVVRTAANPALLTGVAVILPPASPAYAGAQVLAARAAATPPPPPNGDDDDPELDEDGNPIERDADGNVIPPATDPAGPAGRAAIAEQIRREVARYGLGAGRRVAAHPLARFTSAADLFTAARNAPEPEQRQIARAFNDAYRQHVELVNLSRTTLGRVMANQITTDNPGVMPPTWLTTIFGIVDTGRAGITALGGPQSAGDSGMDIYWPYFDGDLKTLVGEQVAQKTDIVSVKVSFKRGQATLKTYAGGSDISYQLQRRSSPSYRAAYDRIMQVSYGVVTEIVFDAALVAGAGGTVVYDPMAGDPDGAGLKAALFAASAKVNTATGQPATAALVASDVFAVLGGQPWLMPPAYGTQNIPGTAQASTLRINVSGLEITEAVGMPAGSMVVTNELAAGWFEDGPFVVTAEDVAKLGTDVAIWGMGTPGLTVPAGVVKMVASQALAAKAEKDAAKALADAG